LNKKQHHNATVETSLSTSEKIKAKRNKQAERRAKRAKERETKTTTDRKEATKRIG
jgi:hypothetical protein